MIYWLFRKGEDLILKKMLNKNCSIAISSCDAYSDVWSAFFTLFFKYWPDCPFPIYLVSETKKYSDDRVKMLNIGDDKGWAANLKSALKKIDSPYILYLQEDYFLKSKVNTNNIIKLFDYLKKEKAGCLRLYPSPGPNMRYKNSPDAGEINKTVDYSISTQATIWDKKVLENLLIDGESGWDMEIKGSKRISNLKTPFLCVYKKAIDYFCTAIKRGRWYYDAVKLCEKEGIKIDKNKRPIESGKEYFLRISKITSFIQKINRFIKKIYE